MPALKKRPWVKIAIVSPSFKSPGTSPNIPDILFFLTSGSSNSSWVLVGGHMIGPKGAYEPVLEPAKRNVQFPIFSQHTSIYAVFNGADSNNYHNN